jgi:hypothetical protein
LEPPALAEQGKTSSCAVADSGFCPRQETLHEFFPAPARCAGRFSLSPSLVPPFRPTRESA